MGFEIRMNIVSFIIHIDSTQVKETCKESAKMFKTKSENGNLNQ